ncbi:hypothetical protein KY285_022344 [Solanum tuberosum]|nr:hypothetical protein KY285_022344 [Solanum tuberosum]
MEVRGASGQDASSPRVGMGDLGVGCLEARGCLEVESGGPRGWVPQGGGWVGGGGIGGGFLEAGLEVWVGGGPRVRVPRGQRWRWGEGGVVPGQGASRPGVGVLGAGCLEVGGEGDLGAERLEVGGGGASRKNTSRRGVGLGGSASGQDASSPGWGGGGGFGSGLGEGCLEAVDGVGSQPRERTPRGRGGVGWSASGQNASRQGVRWDGRPRGRTPRGWGWGGGSASGPVWGGGATSGQDASRSGVVVRPRGRTPRGRGTPLGRGWGVVLGAGQLKAWGGVGVGLGAGRLKAGGGVLVRPRGVTPRGWGWGGVMVRPRGRTPRGWGWWCGLGAGCLEAGGGGVASRPRVRGVLGAVRLVAEGGVRWQDASRPRVASEKGASRLGVGVALGQGSSRPGSKQLIKKPKYVQISVESNSHLTGLEDQVKSLEEQVNVLEDEVKDLNEKFSAAQLEMTNKENLIRNLKEEHEQNLHDAIQNKAKQFDKMKHEFEAKIANLDQQLLRSAAENSALPSSLQECSSMVIHLSEKKSQAEAEIEMLKSNIESCEREINSLKYDLHINSKELEIRNEEKNMSVRSAEVGPAALAQMKLEVESLGRDYGDSRKFHKENEQLTERLLAMEEETKMLKELQANFEQKSPQKSTIPRQPSEGSFSHEANHLPRLASMSEDGNDDNVICASSWTTALRSDLSHIKKEKNSDSPHKSESASHLDLMDDFLEMEKLAYQSSDTNGAVSSPDIPNNARPETTSPDSQLKEHNETNKSISMKLQSRISTVLESLSKEADIQRIQEDLRDIVQEMRNAVILQSTKSIVEITLSSKTATESQSSLDDGEANLDKEIPVSEDIKSCNESIMGTAPDGSGINESLDDFSATYVEVALPENKGLQHSGEVYANGCAHFSDSTSDPDIPHEGSLVPTSEMETAADLDAKTNQHYSCDLEKERGSSRSREKEREKRRDKDRMERFLVQVAVSTNKDSVGERQPRVLLWEIEPLTTFLMYPSPFSLRLKRPWSPGLSLFLGLSNGDMTINSQLPWLPVAWVIRGYNHLISRVLVLLHSCSQGLMIGSKWQ